MKAVKKNFYELIEENPVIAAIKDDEELKICNTCDEVSVIFVLYGDICSIQKIVDEIKEAGKIAIVHMDLIEGLSGKESTVDFIKENTRADGIISIKPALIKRGKELGLYTVLRIFILDSMAFGNIQRQLNTERPDVLEILPGLMPKIIKRICSMTKIPVIAGGLITEKEDVVAALSAGAVSVSTTNTAVWKM